jgi:hypothetical protein
MQYGGNTDINSLQMYTDIDKLDRDEVPNVLHCAISAKLAYLNIIPIFNNDGENITINEDYTRGLQLFNFNIYNNPEEETLVLFKWSEDSPSKLGNITSEIINKCREVGIHDIIKKAQEILLFKQRALPSQSSQPKAVARPPGRLKADSFVSFGTALQSATPDSRRDPSQDPSRDPRRGEILKETKNTATIQYYLMYSKNIKKYILAIRGTYTDDKTIATNNWGTNVQLGLFSLRKKYISILQQNADNIPLQLDIMADFLHRLLYSSIKDLGYVIPELLNCPTIKIPVIGDTKISDKSILELALIMINNIRVKNIIKELFKKLITYGIDRNGIDKTITFDMAYEYFECINNEMYNSLDEIIPRIIRDIIPHTKMARLGYERVINFICNKIKSIYRNKNVSDEKKTSIYQILYNYIFKDYLLNACRYSNSVYLNCKTFINVIHGDSIETKNKYFMDNFIITGHSLAGGITQFLSRKYDNKCYAFNPVGTNIIKPDDYMVNTLYIDIETGTIMFDTNEYKSKKNLFNFVIHFDIVHKIRLSDNYSEIHNSDIYLVSLEKYLPQFKDSYLLLDENYPVEKKSELLKLQLSNITRSHSMDGILLLLFKIYDYHSRHYFNQDISYYSIILKEAERKEKHDSNEVDKSSKPQDKSMDKVKAARLMRSNVSRSALSCIQFPIHLVAQSMYQNSIVPPKPVELESTILHSVLQKTQRDPVRVIPTDSIPCPPSSISDYWQCAYCYYKCNESRRCDKCYIPKSPVVKSWHGFWFKYLKYKNKYLKLKNKQMLK